MYYVIEIFRFLLNVFNFKKKMIVPGPIYKIFVQKYNYKKINSNFETITPKFVFRKIQMYGEPNEILIKILSFLSNEELEMSYGCCMEFALASFTLMSRRNKKLQLFWEDIKFRITTNYCYFCRKEGKNGYVLDNSTLKQCLGGCLRYGCVNCLKIFNLWDQKEACSHWACEGCWCLCNICKTSNHPRNIDKCFGCGKTFCYGCDEAFVITKRNLCSECWNEVLESRRFIYK